MITMFMKSNLADRNEQLNNEMTKYRFCIIMVFFFSEKMYKEGKLTNQRGEQLGKDRNYILGANAPRTRFVEGSVSMSCLYVTL